MLWFVFVVSSQLRASELRYLFCSLWWVGFFFPLVQHAVMLFKRHRVEDAC